MLAISASQYTAFRLRRRRQAAQDESPALLRHGLGSNRTAPIFLAGERDPVSGQVFVVVRIICQLRCNNGRLIWLAEGRSSTADNASRGVIYRFSDDEGHTRSPLHVLHLHPGFAAGTNFLNLSGGVVDPLSGRVFVLVGENLTNFGVLMSEANGNFGSFTKLDGSALSGNLGGTDITADVRVRGALPSGHTFKVRTSTIASIGVGNPTTINCTSAHGIPSSPGGAIWRVKQSGFTTLTQLNVEANGTYIDADSYSVPIDTTGGSMDGSPIYDGVWGWIGGPGSRGIAHSSGRLLLFVHHRESIDTSGLAYNHCIVCDNPTASPPVFALGGGVSETAGGGATNGGANELCATELADGSLLGLCRNTTSGSQYRWKLTSSDVGATWSNISQVTALLGVETQGQIVRLPTGNVVVATFPGDLGGTARARLTAGYSLDNGATWVKRDLGMTFAGYSDAVVLPRNRIAIAYETGFVDADPANGAQVRAYEGIGFLIVSRKFLTEQTDADAYIDLCFNDDGATARSIPTGPTIHDHGTFGLRIHGGIPGDVPTAVFAADGLDNVLKGIRLCPAGGSPVVGMQAWVPDADESMSWEYIFTSTDKAFVLLSTRDNVANTKGVTIQLDASGFVVGTVGDGTTQTTITGDFDVSAVGLVAVTLVLNRSLDQLELYINGVQDVDPVPLTTDGGLVNVTHVGKLAEWPNATNGRATTNLKIKRVLCHRRALGAGEFTDKNAARPTLQDLTGLLWPLGFNPIGSPAALSGCKLWLFPTGLYAYAGVRGGANGDYMRVPMVGDVAHSCVDLSDDRWLSRTAWGNDLPMYYESDVVGGTTIYSWRHVYLSAASAGTRHLLPLSRGDTVGEPVNFDWLQTTALGTISFCIEFDTIGVQQIVLDNIDGSAANPGLYITLESSNKFHLTLTRGGANKFTETINHTAVSAGQKYFVSLQMLGNTGSDKVDIFVKPLTGSAVTIGAGDRVTSTASIAVGSGSLESTKDLSIFSTNAGGIFLRGGKVSNLAFHDNLLTQDAGTLANLTALANFNL